LAFGAIYYQRFQQVGDQWNLTTTVHLANDGHIYVDMYLRNGRKLDSLTGTAIIELRDSNNSILYQFKITKSIGSAIRN